MKKEYRKNLIKEKIIINLRENKISAINLEI